MTIDKEASRRWRRRIKEVLHTEWDPIGVAALSEGEYDAYVGKIAAMLRDQASDRELLEYLSWAETIHMGLRGDSERLTRVVVAIRAIGFMN